MQIQVLHMRKVSCIQAFALHSYILQYPVILLADSECPDQTAQMCRLILTFCCICPKTHFRIAHPARIGLDKSGYQVNIFLISPWKHIVGTH